MIKYQVYTAKNKQVILPEGEITKAIWDSKKSELDTYRTTQTNKILTDLRARTKKDSKNDHRAIFMDLANGVIIWARLLAGDTLTDPKVATEYFYLRTPKGATDINFTELFSNWEVPEGNTKVDKIIKELFEKYTELQKTELAGKTIDQVAIKNELVNLIKKYIDTKVEGVAAGSADIINDTTANTTQTYSSSKIEAVVKSKTDTLQNSLSSLSSNTANALNQKVDITTHSAFATQVTKDLNDKANKTDIPSVENLGNTFLSKTDAESTYIKSTSPKWRKVPIAEYYENFEVGHGKSYILKTPNNENFERLSIYASARDFRAPDDILYLSSSNEYSFLFLKQDNTQDHILGKQTLCTYPASSVCDLVFPGMRKFYTSFKKFSLGASNNFDLRYALNFEITVPSQMTFYFPIKNDIYITGQSGIFLVHNANNITGWSSGYKWREVPENLKETEVFAYFVASDNAIYMGRA